MAKLNPLDIFVRQRQIFSIEDEFNMYVDTQLWTKAVGTSATVAAGTSSVGGQLVLTTAAASASNVALAASTNKGFKFLQDQPAAFEARFQFTEGNVNQANVFFGFSSVVSTALFVASNGGINTNFSGCGIFKVGGTSQWQTISSLGSTQTITKVNLNDSYSNASDGNFHTMRVEVAPITASLAEVRYFIDGQQIRSTVVPTAVFGIVDQLTYTGAAAMSAVVGVMSGTTATNSEVLNVDYIDAWQVRYATGKSY